MHRTRLNPKMTNEIVARAIATRACARPSNTLLFSELTDLLSELFSLVKRPDANLVTCGQFTPDVAMAAERADLAPVEILGRSPFRGDLKPVFGQLNGGCEMVYLANPNRITGACYSLSDIESLARRAAKGMVIIDEYYFNYLGISAFTLLDSYDNLLILRTLTPPPVEPGLTGGFALGGESLIGKLRQKTALTGVLPDLESTLTTDADTEEDLHRRTIQICGESRRLTTALRCLGVECRHTPTDFVLMRVASPKDVGNFLARQQVPIENLDGYPQMSRSIRYFVRSHDQNEGLVDAFRDMPEHYFRPPAEDDEAGPDNRQLRRRALETDPESRVSAHEELIPEDS